MRRSSLFLTLLTVTFPAFMLWGNPDAPVPVPRSVMPWEVEVYREYCPALTDEAHITDCWTGYKDEELHIVVVTATPALVPSEIDAIPILTVAPQTPEQSEGEQYEDPSPPAVLPWAVEVYRAYCPALVAEAHIEDCWTGYVDADLYIVVVTAMPTLVPSELDTIPILAGAAAPPGTIGQNMGNTEAPPSSRSPFLPQSRPSSASLPRPRLPSGSSRNSSTTPFSVGVDSYGSGFNYDTPAD